VGDINAPVPQLVALISGVVNVSCPESGRDREGKWVIVRGGRNGLIVVVATVGGGHDMEYPGGKETVV
jgi:hypothetical protein